jgi:hypothetical protein
MQIEWVLTQYTAGSDNAKSALSLAKLGSYIIINKDRSPADNLVVAFTRSSSLPLSVGMVKASPEQIIKLDKMR